MRHAIITMEVEIRYRKSGRNFIVTIPMIFIQTLGLKKGKNIKADINLTQDGTITIKPIGKIPELSEMHSNATYWRKNFENKSPEVQKILKDTDWDKQRREWGASKRVKKLKKKIKKMLIKSSKERKKIIKFLEKCKSEVTVETISKELNIPKESVQENLIDLYKDGIVSCIGNKFIYRKIKEKRDIKEKYKPFLTHN